MMKIKTILLVYLLLLSCTNAQKLEGSETEEKEIIDIYGDTVSRLPINKNNGKLPNIIVDALVGVISNKLCVSNKPNVSAINLIFFTPSLELVPTRQASEINQILVLQT